jgi:hypothetical protein
MPLIDFVDPKIDFARLCPSWAVPDPAQSRHHIRLLRERQAGAMDMLRRARTNKSIQWYQDEIAKLVEEIKCREEARARCEPIVLDPLALETEWPF